MSVTVASCAPLLVFLALLSAVTFAKVNCQPSVNETAARLWYNEYDRLLGQENNKVAEAYWAHYINITKENGQKLVEAKLKHTEFLKAKGNEMRQLFLWKNFTDANLTKLFDYANYVENVVANDTRQKLYGHLKTDMQAIYSTAKVRHPETGKLIPLDPDITREMADPNQSESVKRALWVGWRDASGKQMRQNYTEFVTLGNAMNREAGYKNLAKIWQSRYEPRPGQDFEKMMADLWKPVEHFYKHLHAYVRRKLKMKYGEHLFPPTGQIPAHILGNMWAQSWLEVEKLTTPFPDLNTVDITEQMQKQGWNASKMFRVSDDFFTSIGLDKMTDTFWEKSVLERIPNVEMNCHASTFDLYSGQGDFRIMQCTSITADYLAITHHEMGHVQYFQQYEKQPVVYRHAANPGFHDSIGDIVELAVMTPDHLVTIGLLNNTIDSKNYYLNYLFQMALQKVAFIPFGYLIDQWRWRAFDGSLKPDKFNDVWWQLRCAIQGVASPVRRSGEDFDPGAKYHVAFNVPYIRYFVSHILQFQLYEALCNKSGHTGPLYRCDFYNNRMAGDALKKMMAHGSSLHWEDVLEELTGSRQISPDSLLRYFADLITFLEAENAKSGEEVGWQLTCPPDSWYDVSSTAAPIPTATFKAVTAATGASWALIGSLIAQRLFT